MVQHGYIPKYLTFRTIDIPSLQQPTHPLKRVISVTGTFHHLTVVKLIPSWYSSIKPWFYVNCHVDTKQNTGAQEIPILCPNFYLIMQNFIFGTPCDGRIANHVHFADSINSEWYELLREELHSPLLPQTGREGKGVTLARSTCCVGRPCDRSGAKYPPCERTQDTEQNTSNK